MSLSVNGFMNQESPQWNPHEDAVDLVISLVIKEDITACFRDGRLPGEKAHTLHLAMCTLVG